ncbi:hypothetical protein FJO69_02895 [[Mycoplasma] falconis]|uniref:Uncharacterized protein n=1 Tax=[Mycoplasma] falconis TaxID=92403 RepID=A0A501X815_9BACT|nr:hypothetical protein [[Mycoplasma] falconis]TPE56564.1 hypothetical protein FJO69_02895 [[Mycoplasma] falconis]
MWRLIIISLLIVILVALLIWGAIYVANKNKTTKIKKALVSYTKIIEKSHNEILMINNQFEVFAKQTNILAASRKIINESLLKYEKARSKFLMLKDKILNDIDNHDRWHKYKLCKCAKKNKKDLKNIYLINKIIHEEYNNIKSLEIKKGSKIDNNLIYYHQCLETYIYFEKIWNRIENVDWIKNNQDQVLNLKKQTQTLFDWFRKDGFINANKEELDNKKGLLNNLIIAYIEKINNLKVLNNKLKEINLNLFDLKNLYEQNEKVLGKYLENIKASFDLLKQEKEIKNIKKSLSNLNKEDIDKYNELLNDILSTTYQIKNDIIINLKAQLVLRNYADFIVELIEGTIAKYKTYNLNNYDKNLEAIYLKVNNNLEPLLAFLKTHKDKWALLETIDFKLRAKQVLQKLFEVYNLAEKLFNNKKIVDDKFKYFKKTYINLLTKINWLNSEVIDEENKLFYTNLKNGINPSQLSLILQIIKLYKMFNQILICDAVKNQIAYQVSSNDELKKLFLEFVNEKDLNQKYNIIFDYVENKLN